MLHGEWWELLFLYRRSNVELAWSQRVLYEKECNAAGHHGWGHWQRVSAIYNERLVRHDTEQIVLDWRSRSSEIQFCRMALDQRTTIKFVIVYCILYNSNSLDGHRKKYEQLTLLSGAVWLRVFQIFFTTWRNSSVHFIKYDCIKVLPVCNKLSLLKVSQHKA